MKSLSHKAIDFNVWDIGGQKAIRKHWSNYYDECEALMYVIDATDKKRLAECLEELEAILEVLFILTIVGRQIGRNSIAFLR